jgi:hypothetical protein
VTERGPDQPEDDWGSPATPWNQPGQPARPPESAPPQPTYPPTSPQPQGHPPPYPPQQPQWQQPAQPWAPGQHAGTAPNFVIYLILSIVATLFCCLPTGIVAIVYAAQIQSKTSAGDFAGAAQAAKRAQIWLIASVGLGLLGLAVYIIAVAGSSGSSY